MEHAEMIERLMEKTTLGEEEARSALEQNGWNLLDALIAEERAGRLKGKSNSYRTDEAAPAGKAAEEHEADGRQDVVWFSTDGIERIEIDWVNGNADVALWDDDRIMLTEEGKRPLAKAEKMCCTVRNGTLKVVYSESGVFFHKARLLTEKRLTLRLPRTMHPGAITLTCVSADWTVKDVRTDKLRLKTVSGNCTLERVDAECLEIAATSGWTALRACSVDGSTAIKTVSGSVRCFDCRIGRQISVHSVSGDVAIELPADAPGFALRFETVSGDVQSSVPTTGTRSQMVCGDGSLAIQVNTVSGGLTVAKL